MTPAISSTSEDAPNRTLKKPNSAVPSPPELTVTVDWATAKAIFVDQNPQAGMQAFMAGKIKVQGDMTKLMAMQAGPIDPSAQKLAEAISAMTEEIQPAEGA